MGLAALKPSRGVLVYLGDGLQPFLVSFCIHIDLIVKCIREGDL